MLGLPKLLSEDDVGAEYPSDIDDEYVSEKGFLPTLPGDSTKISSALALFRSSRVLARVLDIVYPHGDAREGGARELTYRRLKELEEELEVWMKGLAPHLRLEFVNGVPGTNVVHSRSPLLVCDRNSIGGCCHIEDHCRLVNQQWVFNLRTARGLIIPYFNSSCWELGS